MTLLLTAVSSIGIMTTLLSSTYAQEQAYNASLGGENEVPPNNSTAKGSAWFKPTNDSVAYQVNATGLDKVTVVRHTSWKGRREWKCGCSFVRTVRQCHRTC